MRKFTSIVLLMFVIVLANFMQSCQVLCPSKKAVTTENHPNKIIFIAPLESIDILFSESEVLTVIPNDFNYITDILKRAKYDKKWNETGMMVKMRTPDYSLEVKSEGAVSRMVFLWQEGSRVKVDEIWYLLPAGESQKLTAFLSKYKI